MTLGERVKMIREDSGKTQKDMAGLVDIGLRTWQQYEEGVHDPSWKVVVKLTELGFSADWLATGEGLMRRGETTCSLAEGHKNTDSTGEQREAFDPKEKRADRSPVKAAAVSYIDNMTDAEAVDIVKIIVDRNEDPLLRVSAENRKELHDVIKEQIKKAEEFESSNRKTDLSSTGT